MQISQILFSDSKKKRKRSRGRVKLQKELGFSWRDIEKIGFQKYRYNWMICSHKPIQVSEFKRKRTLSILKEIRRLLITLSSESMFITSMASIISLILPYPINFIVKAKLTDFALMMKTIEITLRRESQISITQMMKLLRAWEKADQKL